MSTKPTPTTWPLAIDRFEAHLHARRCSKATVKKYLDDLALLRRLVGSKAPPALSTDDLRRHQLGLLTGTAARSKRPLCPATVQRITTAWRTCFRFLLEEGLLAHDPAARLESPKVPQRSPGEVLTVAEVGRLLRAPDPLTPRGLRDRAILDVLFSTGLRNGEVCALDMSDLDHAQREVVVRAGKGEKGRIVPLILSAWERVAAYVDDGRGSLATDHPDSHIALFLTPRGRRIHAQTLLQVLRRYTPLAKIRKNITPHTLRRTFATVLLKSGVSIRHIQALLGHESLSTTARAYLRLDRGDLHRELLLKHPRERFEA